MKPSGAVRHCVCVNASLCVNVCSKKPVMFTYCLLHSSSSIAAHILIFPHSCRPSPFSPQSTKFGRNMFACTIHKNTPKDWQGRLKRGSEVERNLDSDDCDKLSVNMINCWLAFKIQCVWINMFVCVHWCVTVLLGLQSSAWKYLGSQRDHSVWANVYPCVRLTVHLCPCVCVSWRNSLQACELHRGEKNNSRFHPPTEI